MPKYLIRNFSYLHLKMLRMRNKDKVFSPRHIRKLFMKLIFNTDHASKQYRAHSITIASLSSACPKIRVSSVQG